MRQEMTIRGREVSELGARVNEMMAQMTQMMQMMQRNIAAGPVPVPQNNHQASVSANANPPVNPLPQTSGVQFEPEGRNEVHQPVSHHVFQHAPQNILSTSEPVTAAQLETIISEKIKAVIALEQAEKWVSKGRPYPAEYDQVSYPKGYSVPKLSTLSGSGNPKQHLAQFKATCGNTGGNDALLFRQFVSSLTSTAFEWYAELPNDSIKTFAELDLRLLVRCLPRARSSPLAWGSFLMGS